MLLSPLVIVSISNFLLPLIVSKNGHHFLVELAYIQQVGRWNFDANCSTWL